MSEDLTRCRAAFVAMVKEEEQFKDQWARSSLRQHWKGAHEGFADDFIQKRWQDFKAGWLANRSV